MRAPRHHEGIPSALAAALIVVISPRGAALASPPARPSSLSWVRLPGAEACSSAHTVARAVERRLGRPAFVAATQASLAIEGRIERTRSPQGFRATIAVADEHGAPLGTRTLRTTGSRCEALDDEIVLVIALAIDPDAALTPPGAPAPEPPPPAPRIPAEPPRTPPFSPAPAPEPPPPLPAALGPGPAPVVPWQVGFTVGPMMSVGALPSVGAGVTVRGWFQPPRWPVFEVAGMVQRTQRVAPSTYGATFALASGQIAVGPPAVTRWGFALRGRVGLELGALRAGGFGFDVSRTQEQVVADALAGAVLLRRLAGPLLAAVSADVAVPLSRDRFYYTDTDRSRRDVFRMAPVTLALGIGLGVEIP